MTLADCLLLALVATVSALLALAATPVLSIRLLLVVTTLAVSSLLFLPSDLLVEVVGLDYMHRLYGWSSKTPWRPSEWIHLLGFACLASALWLAHSAARWAPLVAALVGLAIAAELAQWLTATRTPRLEDAVVNLLGVALGVGTAAVLRATWPDRE